MARNNNEQSSGAIYVVKEPYEKDGKSYNAYVINGNVRGKDVKAHVAPPDVGGYTVLDIVFLDADKAELIRTPFEIRDEKTGRVVTGFSYVVRTIDENGEVYECPVKPQRRSDKDLLNLLFR